MGTGRSGSELAEALLDLRTSLLSSLEAKRARTLLFTSAAPSEGKTTISSNISIALGRLGKAVLLIEGDLRLPSVHRFFALPNDVGLGDYLEGNRDWPEVVQSSEVSRLDVIAGGERFSHPTELFSWPRMAALIREARSQYDYVIVDSPTLLKITDSRILAGHVEAVVLVVKRGVTPRAVVKQAQASLRSVSNKVIGVVLNRWDAGLGDPLNYYSHYHYTGVPEKSLQCSRR
jgi:capsular exopolysaccharide synthesis family protein